MVGAVYWLTQVRGYTDVSKSKKRKKSFGFLEINFDFSMFYFAVYVDRVKWTSLFYPSSTFKVHWTTQNLVYTRNGKGKFYLMLSIYKFNLIIVFSLLFGKSTQGRS